MPTTPRKLQPSGDHILIRYAEAVRPSPKPIDATAKIKLHSAAKVIAVGPGHEGADGNRIPLGLKVGERIVVRRACGIKIRLHRRNYAVIRRQDLVESRA